MTMGGRVAMFPRGKNARGVRAGGGGGGGGPPSCATTAAASPTSSAARLLICARCAIAPSANGSILNCRDEVLSLGEERIDLNVCFPLYHFFCNI